MSDANTCGACTGTAVAIPSSKVNRSGESSIGYRVGTHQEFKAALLSRLSTTDFPALGPLTVRGDEDFTIAACDAFAVLADVLTFYQERIANESYLRTAVERRSVLHLARLIGYRLAPGVAATTALAFTLESAPGAPALAAQPVTIPVGTRVQSVPDAGQEAQTFETTAAITGRVEWNAIPVHNSETVAITRGLRELYLVGINTGLQQGDWIGLISGEREVRPDSNRWSVRALDSVEVDLARNVTRIRWSLELGPEWAGSMPTEGVRFYAFRQRAAMFGHNAPDPRLLQVKSPALVTEDEHSRQWLNFGILPGQEHLDLDAAYPRITAKSWLVLVGIGEEPNKVLLGVNTTALVSRTDFGLSGRLTRVTSENLPIHNPEKFPLRETQVLAQSEPLPISERPLLYPLYGSVTVLGRRQDDLDTRQLVAVSGKRQRVVIGGTSGVAFIGAGRVVRLGDSFIMRRAPERPVGDRFAPLDPEMLDSNVGLSGKIRWHLEADDGTAVTLDAPVNNVVLAPARKEDPGVCEVSQVGSLSTSDNRTILTLTPPLQFCYERSTVSINANVAHATHGETVSEIAGSGDSSEANQTFLLKQGPLTYVSAASEPDGRASTLETRVNDALWTEVPTLSGRGPLERVYTLHQDDNGNSTIQFGDGVNGARLPRANNNVRLRYRRGLGTAGNLRAGQLTLLLTRPLGVKAAVNPSAATGGQDPESLVDARRNAPLPVLTLERAVSVRDYVDFARTFPGIAKAHGTWINDGQRRGIYLTVAGPNGAEVPATSDTPANLIGALRRFGDPLLPLSVTSYLSATFMLKATVKLAADAEPDRVIAAVAASLRARYSFEQREFVQSVTIDEVYATIQNVRGVLAADIDRLRRGDAAPDAPELEARLFAQPPKINGDGTTSAAELLTLDPESLDLGVMP